MFISPRGTSIRSEDLDIADGEVLDIADGEVLDIADGERELEDDPSPPEPAHTDPTLPEPKFQMPVRFLLIPVFGSVVSPTCLWVSHENLESFVFRLVFLFVTRRFFIFRQG